MLKNAYYTREWRERHQDFYMRNKIARRMSLFFVFFYFEPFLSLSFHLLSLQSLMAKSKKSRNFCRRLYVHLLFVTRYVCFL